MAAEHVISLPTETHRRRQQYWRNFKDRLTWMLVTLGGIGVIVAVIAIFGYLLWVVMPLFQSAHIDKRASYSVPGGGKTLLLATEEYAEIGLRVNDNGHVLFFKTTDGQVVSDNALPLNDAAITAFTHGDPAQRVIAAGLSNGNAVVTRHDYIISYANNIRRISPSLSYPLGANPVVVSQGQALRHLAVQSKEDKTTLAALDALNKLHIIGFSITHSLLDDQPTIERSESTLPITGEVTHLLINAKQDELYIATRDGYLHYYTIANPAAPELRERLQVLKPPATITAITHLAGGISLLVGDSSGHVSQWFPTRDPAGKQHLSLVREFTEGTHPVTTIAPEYFRKGFAVLDDGGTLGLYHATAERNVLLEQVADSAILQAVMAPRANALLVEDSNGQITTYNIHNPHPEVSWQSLWGKVWYESRQQPEFTWQSSSASSDFEPKFSLTPLTFGTLKAAFYAMLFAIPISIMGAIYAAYFMSPHLRSAVKPAIEIMGALPTVILGFIAGLWLAPFIEKNLAGVFALFLVLPLMTMLTAYVWHTLPARIRHRFDDGWEAVLLLPILLLTGLAALGLGQILEANFFSGSLPHWITTTLHIPYDQRNSVVVGIAMGFAVIPIIFTISEDAIFSVPKHLTVGSLALGATPWQTLTRVVLLTASPGIFSAIMIGFGRAVGETMIVLMSTGNTPIMDLNVFQGFRALSANIAVEMPEAEVGSSHFRILFLAALVLFAFTFIFNTLAEVVRQRLRMRYSNL